MAVMTRCGGDKAIRVQNDLLVEYYSRRARFELIITEYS